MLSLMFGFLGYLFGQNPFDPIIMIVFGVAILIHCLALLAKSEPTEWICQNCVENLVRSQIKFGLCPFCGVKVENFRGLTYRGSL
jgi:hypothetical protein